MLFSPRELSNTAVSTVPTPYRASRQASITRKPTRREHEIPHDVKQSMSVTNVAAKLQALVYDLLPPTIAIMDYAIGLKTTTTTTTVS